MEPGHPPQSDQMEGKEGKTGIILGSGEFLLKHLSIYIYVKKKKRYIWDSIVSTLFANCGF